jgi:bile acid-coenzyme A ligase
VALPNGTLFHETCFAIWKLGATPHVVSYRLPSGELNAILQLLQPALLVGCGLEGVEGCQVLEIGSVQWDYSDAPLQPKVAKHWKAMSSGGSTGRPKIIVDAKSSELDISQSLFDLPSKSCVLNPGPLYHNVPFIFSHSALARGSRVVGMGKFDAETVLKLIQEHGVSWVMMVPTMMHRIWRLPEDIRNKYDLSSINIVGHVASPMPVWLKEKWVEWLGPGRVYELYGGTEGTGGTWMSGHEWLEHKGSVGKLINGSRARILDENGNDCVPGVIGEVYLMPQDGPGSSYHYVGAEPRIVDGGWDSLGDMGWMDEDGYLYLADRRTDLIISGGANIYPAEVEASLAEHAGVDTAVVIGLPDQDMGQVVHAIVQRDAEWKGDLDEVVLAAFLEPRLVRYKTPRTYEFVDFSLRDDAGKVRRSALRAERVGAS